MATEITETQTGSDGVAFGQAVADWSQWDDTQFLAAVRWTRGVPKNVVSAAASGRFDKFPRAIRRQILRSRLFIGSKQVTAAAERRVLWSRAAFGETPRTEAFVELLESAAKLLAGFKGKSAIGRQEKSRKKSLDSFSSRLLDVIRPTQSASAGTTGEPVWQTWELLCCLDLLPTAAQHASPEAFVACWRTAIEGVQALTADLEPGDLQATFADREVVVVGEIPWTAGVLFDGVAGANHLRKSGRKALQQQLVMATDTDGTPHAELLPRLGYWLAAFVRSLQLQSPNGKTLFENAPEAEMRFRDLLVRVAALWRPDGHVLLHDANPAELLPMLQTAAALCGWKRSAPMSRYLSAVDLRVSKGRPKRKGHKGTVKDRTVAMSSDETPITQSDWARLACLRNGWAANPDTLVVAHHLATPAIDLTALGCSALSGQWDLTLTLDGTPLEQQGEWDTVCWFSDEESDYLEIQVTFENRVRIERQILLSRDQHFAILADSVSGPTAGRLDYTMNLPVAPGVETRTDTQTREIDLLLHQGKPTVTARVFPLSLPERRLHSVAGSFTADAGGLMLRQSWEGRGFYAPVVLDWHPGRRKETPIWRTLTVSENRARAPRDAAASYRLQLGKHHLFFYRSLRKSQHVRAALGHHTSHESVVGYFDSDGEVTPLVLVE